MILPPYLYLKCALALTSTLCNRLVDSRKWTMIEIFETRLTKITSRTTTDQLLLTGLVFRLLPLFYGVIHDEYVSHIKYTDIDYHVFNNGSRNLLSEGSPYVDPEYRYTPLVAILFLPNILANINLGKILLVVADIYCGKLIYSLNIHQGTNRLNSKLYLLLWLFNPVTIAISTRGSFEPILLAVILTSMHQLVNGSYITSGLLIGLSIHLKLYPVIYVLPIYIYLLQRRPYLKTQTRFTYWLKTLCPNSGHLEFLVATGLSFFITSYLSYRLYGHEYLEQSFLYHLRRKDLQHNFSIYFYLFKLLPEYQSELGKIAFLLQAIGVIMITLSLASLDTNKRTKLRKLTFSFFLSTFVFVSLNKVCTSQYFVWYLIFLPLIMDSIRIEPAYAWAMLLTWFMSQANWLFFAYLHEYQNYDILDYVGNSSFLLLACNMWIAKTLSSKFDANLKR